MWSVNLSFVRLTGYKISGGLIENKQNKKKKRYKIEFSFKKHCPDNRL